ncbi:MAG: lipid II:glycine glycyltransferase FemX, partial [Candidatus Binatia bacterium]
MRKLGAVRAPRDVQPAHTWRVDLTLPEDELIAAMRATTRNLHRTAVKKGLSFRKSDDPKEIKILLGFIHEMAQRNSIRPHSDRYLRLQAKTLISRGAAHLFFAEYMGRPIAAAMVYDSHDTRFYAHAGAAAEHRKLHAGTPLVSHMVLDAKKNGLSTFDFYGIAPPGSANHPWSGFTDFKKSFGGYRHNYAGTWDVPLKRVQYRLY